MKCKRCCGLMVTDHLLDMEESFLPMWMKAQRCLTCGNIEDPLIHYNRKVQDTRRAKRPVAPLARPMAAPAQAA